MPEGARDASRRIAHYVSAIDTRKLPERAEAQKPYKALARTLESAVLEVRAAEEKQAQQAMHDLSPCCGATYKTTGSCKTCSACGATSGGCG